MGVKRVNKPGAGRPRVYATDLPVYDSMEQCCGATGIPVEALTFAKKNGCLFIRHGRVHLSEFIHWWWNRDTEDDEDTKEIWDKRDKRAVALTRETKLQNLRNVLIERSLVDAFVRDLVGVIFCGEMERIAAEFPAVLKAKSEIEIHRECLAQLELIRKSLHSKVDLWFKERSAK